MGNPGSSFLAVAPLCLLSPLLGLRLFKGILEFSEPGSAVTKEKTRPHWTVLFQASHGCIYYYCLWHGHRQSPRILVGINTAFRRCKARITSVILTPVEKFALLSFGHPQAVSQTAHLSDDDILRQEHKYLHHSNHCRIDSPDSALGIMQHPNVRPYSLANAVKKSLPP